MLLPQVPVISIDLLKNLITSFVGSETIAYAPRRLTAVSSLCRAGFAGFRGPSRPLGATKRPVLLHKIPNPEESQPQVPSFHEPWAAWKLVLRLIKDTPYLSR